MALMLQLYTVITKRDANMRTKLIREFESFLTDKIEKK